MKNQIMFYRSSKFRELYLFEDSNPIRIPKENESIDNELTRQIKKSSGAEEYNYLCEHIDFNRIDKLIYATRDSEFKNPQLEGDEIRFFIDSQPLNYNVDINQHLKRINTILNDAGVFIGHADTYYSKKNRTLKKYGKFIGKAVLGLDFILNRFLPRISFLTNLYFKSTKGKYYSMSMAEILGRLVYNGFEIIEFKTVREKLFFVVIKTGTPREKVDPTFGPLVKLKRVGKNGNIIDVYKFRTMHPYSEFIQDFVIALNGYNEVGKPANDFRVTQWGRLIRKVWLDELPQLINVVKGNMKLVGVRPLSRVRFSEFPEDMQKLRIKHKPGCFPPYVALNMPDSINNIHAERIYLMDLAKNPLTTDLKYLFLSVFNIITNQIRSS